MTRKNIDLLKLLLDYRIVSVAQITALCFPSRQMARRKIREFAKAKLINVTTRGFGPPSGRPERLISLSNSAVKILKDIGAIRSGLLLESFPSIEPRHFEHQLLLNWVRIYLNHAGECISQINTNFLSPLFHYKDYSFKTDDYQPESSPIPDGIFSISYEGQGRSLLFFLEVDMGTEIISSYNPASKDIRKKILCYQHIFKKQAYKKLEILFQCQFNGFRTLFVANTENRLQQLCKLTKSMTSTDFIWMTDRSSIFRNGISDKIWIKGGDIENNRYSILGPSLAIKTPLATLI